MVGIDRSAREAIDLCRQRVWDQCTVTVSLLLASATGRCHLG